MAVLGKYSYGLYVYHHFFSYFAIRHGTEFALARLIGSHTLAVWLQATTGIVLSMAVAWASYEYLRETLILEIAGIALSWGAILGYIFPPCKRMGISRTPSTLENTTPDITSIPPATIISLPSPAPVTSGIYPPEAGRGVWAISTSMWFLCHMQQLLQKL
jgi:hypothetical protein